MFKKILLLLFFFWLVSCKIFVPRQAEKPDNEPVWNSFFFTPNKTIENLTSAYTNRASLPYYNEILNNDFRFYFSDYDITNYGTPTVWNKSNELSFLQRIYNYLSTSDVIEFILTDTEDDVVLTNEAWIYRNYSIFINHSIDGVSTEFQGRFEFYMIRESNGLWKINRWYDKQNQSSDITIGRLKNEIL